MVPYAGEGIIDRGVMIKVVGTHRTVVARGGDGHPINGKGNPIVRGYIRVEPSVVLLLRDLAWIQGGVFADIRDAVEAATNTRIPAALVSQILRVQAGLEG